MSHLLALGAGAQALGWAIAAVVGLTTLAAFGGGAARGGGGDAAGAWPDRFDLVVAAFAALTFLLVPVAWSQHAMLLVLPAAVLFVRAVGRDEPGGLLLWAGLVVLLSLPDPAVVWTGIGVRQLAGDGLADALPTVPVWAAVALWIWLLVSAVRPGYAAATTPGSPALHGVL